MTLPVCGRNDRIGELGADHVGARITEGSLGGRIELENETLGVHRDNAIECGIEDGPQA